MQIAMNTKHILIFLHQDPEVSEHTQTYIIYLMPSIFVFSQADILRKFLNCFGKNFYPMLSFLISSLIFPFMAKYLTLHLKLDLVGLSISIFVQNVITFTIMIWLFWRDQELNQAFIAPNRNCLHMIGGYTRIGMPTAFL